MARCKAVYYGTSAAHGGQCLLVRGHSGDHKTHGIAVWISGRGEISDGSQGFHWGITYLSPFIGTEKRKQN